MTVNLTEKKIDNLRRMYNLGKLMKMHVLVMQSCCLKEIDQSATTAIDCPNLSYGSPICLCMRRCFSFV